MTRNETAYNKWRRHNNRKRFTLLLCSKKKIHAIIAAKCCKKKKSIMAKIENQKDCARTVKDEAKWGTKLVCRQIFGQETSEKCSSQGCSAVSWVASSHLMLYQRVAEEARSDVKAVRGPEMIRRWESAKFWSREKTRKRPLSRPTAYNCLTKSGERIKWPNLNLKHKSRVYLKSFREKIYGHFSWQYI